MAPHAAKGKKGANAGAHASALGKGAQAHETGAASGRHAQKSEKGVCIICGELRNGLPAKPEFPIRAARWLRALFRQPAKHTIACKEHFEDAMKRRAKFEKKIRDYLIAAAAFFAFVLAGSLLFGRLDLSMALPAFLGALIIPLLPFFYYFPSFGK